MTPEPTITEAARKALCNNNRSTDEPHYVVITGTNIRSTLPGKDYTPKVYDSEAIAKAAINAGIENRKHLALRPRTPKSPISITEYDRKYSAYMCAPKE